MDLIAQPEYRQLTPEQKGSICNGMGAKDSLLSSFIPNTMYGLDVEEAGNIHDFDYHVGLTAHDKRRADRVFLLNMFTLINERGGFLAFLRRRRALKYYEAVKEFGDDAFFANKG